MNGMQQSVPSHSPRLVVEICETPPHPACDDVRWFSYTVTTRSGRNSMTGYTRGPLSQAKRVAEQALRRLELYEGPRRAWEQFSLVLAEMRPTSASDLRHFTKQYRKTLRELRCVHL